MYNARNNGNAATHTKELYALYLFYIVACLCTRFNKQNIHVFRSLLSLFCGYLSVMSHTYPRHANAHRHAHRHTHTDTDKGEKYTVCDHVVVVFTAVPRPAAAAVAISSWPKVIHLSITSYTILIAVEWGWGGTKKRLNYVETCGGWAQATASAAGLQSTTYTLLPVLRCSLLSH